MNERQVNKKLQNTVVRLHFVIQILYCGMFSNISLVLQPKVIVHNNCPFNNIVPLLTSLLHCDKMLTFDRRQDKNTKTQSKRRKMSSAGEMWTGGSIGSLQSLPGELRCGRRLKNVSRTV